MTEITVACKLLDTDKEPDLCYKSAMFTNYAARLLKISASYKFEICVNGVVGLWNLSWKKLNAFINANFCKDSYIYTISFVHNLLES